jgi:hypothetical protein
MKTGFLVFSMIFIAFNGNCQDPVLYTVKSKPLPIHDKPFGKVLVKVPRNKTIALISYDKGCNCFNAQYHKVSGVVKTDIWLNDIYSGSSHTQKARIRDTLSEDVKKLIAEHHLLTPENGFIVEPGKVSDTKSNRTTDLTRKYGYTDGFRISEGKLWLGMNVEMALDSRGIPYRVNRSQGNWGIREQWIYSDVYLYFENGTLTEIFILKSNE